MCVLHSIKESPWVVARRVPHPATVSATYEAFAYVEKFLKIFDSETSFYAIIFIKNKDQKSKSKLVLCNGLSILDFNKNFYEIRLTSSVVLTSSMIIVFKSWLVFYNSKTVNLIVLTWYKHHSNILDTKHLTKVYYIELTCNHNKH